MRLRPRFSLRTMLALVAVSAVWFAWLHWQDVKRAKVIRRIEDLGGSVSKEPGLLGDRAVGITIPWIERSRIPREHLALFPHMRQVAFTNVTWEGKSDKVGSPPTDFYLRATSIQFDSIELVNRLMRNGFAGEHGVPPW